MSTKKKSNGISLRAIHLILVVGAFLLSGLMIYSTYSLSASFRAMTAKSEKHIELQKAAAELMDASDYMTEKVQRFAVDGDLKYLQAYYSEAFLKQRREEALATIASDKESADALKKLKAAMDVSEELMEQEYYAINLVVLANGYDNVPISLDSVELSEEDRALSAEGKMSRAREIVFGNVYYSKKYIIRSKTNECISKIDEHIKEADKKALSEARNKLNVLRMTIAVGAFSLIAAVWVASCIGINPILKAVEKIKNNSKIPEKGTSEFRYLVREYNRLYDVYKKSIEKLNFKAYHDELTGVYNRAGYEMLVDNIEVENTYMLLFDVDNFKGINDTYGHDTGDRVLIKLADTIKKHFRPDDFVCRIGGDEFIVFMLHFPEKNDDIIAQKINSINSALENTEDGLPALSISVGIVHGSEAQKVEDLFEKTDSAMYEAKQKGKKTYTFYTPDLNK